MRRERALKLVPWSTLKPPPVKLTSEEVRALLAPQLVLEHEQYRIVKDPFWFHMDSKQPLPYEVAGKYQFLSSDRERLQRIAENEILKHGFHQAKWSTTPYGGPDNILLLYYADDSRKMELMKRAQQEYGWCQEPDSRRSWKTDAAIASDVRPLRWVGAGAVEWSHELSALHRISSASLPSKAAPSQAASSLPRRPLLTEG